jgi:very-short-patch-repair endonuclease
MQPLLVIELDGTTHVLRERQERDKFLDNVFAAVGLPILHVPVQPNYDKRAIAIQIAGALGLVKRTE